MKDKQFNKSQIAVEYMLILGIALLVMIPTFYYAIKETNVNIQLNQANDAVNTLGKAADTVYSIGPGTKKNVWINMPNGVRSYSLTNKEVSIKLFVFKGESDVFAKTKANLTGTLPISKGTHRISVEMLESGIVELGNSTG